MRIKRTKTHLVAFRDNKSIAKLSLATEKFIGNTDGLLPLTEALNSIKNQPFLVFVVNADNIPDDLNISHYQIDEWANYKGLVLPDIAHKFMQIAKDWNRVYTLIEFMEEYNLYQSIVSNDYIFITNKY